MSFIQSAVLFLLQVYCIIGMYIPIKILKLFIMATLVSVIQVQLL